MAHMVGRSVIDFQSLIESNPNRIHRIYEQSRAWGCRPHELMYPKLRGYVAQYTFDDMVWEHSHEQWLEQQMMIYGMGGLKGVL